MKISGQTKGDSDAGPDQHERGEHPEKEGGLADGKPWKLRAIEEKARSPEDTAVIVALGDLAPDRGLGIVRSSPGAVDVVAGRPGIAGHDSSVASIARTPTSRPDGKDGERMSRLVGIPVVCTALALAAWLGPVSAAGGAGGSPGTTFVAQLGDRVRVVDAPIACQVVRVRELGHRVALDCRRSGPLRGSAGTLLTGREAALVRFADARVARIVSMAEHDGELRRCR